MICPKCEMEYVDSVAVCNDCDTELISVVEFEGNLVHHADWVVAYTTDVMYEAEMYKANLESAGIEVNILGQKDKNFPVPGDLSIVKLLIKKADAEVAAEIMQDIEKNAKTEPNGESEEE